MSDEYELVDVPTEHVKVGDIVLSASVGDGMFNVWTTQTVLTAPVRDPEDDPVYGAVWVFTTDKPSSVRRSHHIIFRVKRKVKCGNKDFPHQCPRCGQDAYVGLFEVTHKQEWNAMSCPARRG